MPFGCAPTVVAGSAANVPPPAFNSTDTEPEPALATAMSERRSPLKSAIANWRGCTPTA